MNHTMNLNPKPFHAIEAGTKDIELRLYDEKRQRIQVGDYITFQKIDDQTCTLTVKVIKLHRFASFKDLYEHCDLTRCGYTKEDVHLASFHDMEDYYPIEKQKKYGVLGIEIQLIQE